MATAAPPINNTFGSVLIGSFVGFFIYGMTIQAAYRYFRLYPTDSWRLKGMIIVLVILDAVQMVEAGHTCYYYLVLHYSDPSALGIGVWSTRLLSVTRGITVFIVQMFYCRRISVLAPEYFKYLIVAMIPLMLSELGFSAAAAVEAFLVRTFTGWEHVVWIDGVALGVVLVADAMVAATMVFILYRSRTGLKGTDSLLSLLIIYTLNTCVLTSFMNALTLIVLIVSPKDLMYVGLSISAAQTYSISVLAVVNSRKSFAEIMDKTYELGSFGLSDIPPIPSDYVNGCSRSQLKVEDVLLSTNASICRLRMPVEEGSSDSNRDEPGVTEI